MEVIPQRGASGSVVLTKCYSGNKINQMRWVGHVVRMGDRRGAHIVLVGKPEGKRKLGRPR
jgi:hypothetical protein